MANDHRLGPAEAMALERDAIMTVAPALALGAPGSVPLAAAPEGSGLPEASMTGSGRGSGEDDDAANKDTADDGEDEDGDGDVGVAETSPG